MSEWRWNPRLIGYAFHHRGGSAWIQLAYRLAKLDPDAQATMRVAEKGSSEAAAFDVAIVTPGRAIDRLRLRGSLGELKEQLLAVLDRRLGQPTPPPDPPLPKWNGAGCWCPLHASEK